MPMYRLSNPTKHYDWGHPSLIPDFLGVANPGGEPVAEVWMGTHPGGPSQVETTEGWKDLRSLHPAGLPSLLKLLAARHALSIQAHPNLEQAQAGFRRENERGLGPEDPRRNYKDPNHKPEVLVALEAPFWGLAGFRDITEIRADLDRLCQLASAPLPLLDELRAALDQGGLKALTRILLGADREAWRLQEPILAEAFARSALPQAPWYPKLAGAFPGDPSALFLVILNLFRLEPGEALFTPAGCLHAYLEGFALELMAASDNVLRGGLTPKAVDRAELERILVFESSRPQVLIPVIGPSGEEVFTPPVPDFALGRLKAQGRVFPLGMVAKPWILLVTEGRAWITQGPETLDLKRGESAVLLPAPGAVTLRVEGTVYRTRSGG